MKDRGELKLRVFLIYMNASYKENDKEGQRILKEKIGDWCDEQRLHKTAMLWVPSPTDSESCKLFEINPKATNTILVYKGRRVIANLVNQDYDAKLASTILDLL